MRSIEYLSKAFPSISFPSLSNIPQEENQAVLLLADSASHEVLGMILDVFGKIKTLDKRHAHHKPIYRVNLY